MGFDLSANIRSLASGEQKKSHTTSYCKERQFKFPSAMQLTDSHSPLQQYFQRCQSQVPETLFHPGTPVWGIYGCQILGRCCLQRKKKVETRTSIPVSFKVLNALEQVINNVLIIQHCNSCKQVRKSTITRCIMPEKAMDIQFKYIAIHAYAISHVGKS